MACNPATPAPRTRTRAGAMVPAAVVSSGNILGSWVAASSTARYPDTVACEESTSMPWALVMRGRSSRANSMAPRSATAAAASGDPRGLARPTTTSPGRIRARSWSAPGALTPTVRTWTTTSAPKASSREETISASFSRYRSSRNPAASPAPDSTRTRRPALARAAAARGVTATRRSSGNVSRGTPTVEMPPGDACGPGSGELTGGSCDIASPACCQPERFVRLVRPGPCRNVRPGNPREVPRRRPRGGVPRWAGCRPVRHPDGAVWMTSQPVRRRRVAPRVAAAIAVAVVGTCSLPAPVANAAAGTLVLGQRGAGRAAGVPPTVSSEVSVDLSGALPRAGVRTLQGGAVRTLDAATSAPVRACPGFWFTALGLVWRQRGDGVVRARVSWTGVDGSVLGRTSVEDEGPGPGTPDAGGVRRGTDLVWTGGGRCAMVTRAAWGADARLLDTGSPGCTAPYYSPEVKVAYVHHTSGSNSYGPSQSDDIVRGIDWFHTQERGYCDIAYLFLIDRYGRIFVGRAGGVDRPVTPGSQSGFNAYTASVSIMGNFQSVSPPLAAVRSLERLLAWRLDVAHVPADGFDTLVSQGYGSDVYPPGKPVRLHTIVGHRRTSSTDCPGNRFLALLPTIRRTVAAMGGPKILRPKESAPKVVPGADPVRFTARATAPLAWTLTVERRDRSVVRQMSVGGRFTTVGVRWNGTDTNGDPAPAGKYRAVLSGRTKSGVAPRSAELPIDVPGPHTGPVPVPGEQVRVRSGPVTLRGVAATSGSDVWVVGSMSRIAATRPFVRHFDGSSWRGVGAPNPGSHGSALQAVVAPAPDDAWAGGLTCTDGGCGAAGGFGSRTLLEHWDGKRWAAVPSPSPGTATNEIRALAAVAPDDVWAAGFWSDEGRYLRHGLVLHWDGSAWSQARLPFVGGEVHLDGLSAAATDDVWAVGERCPGPCAGLAHSSAVILHWDGQRWSTVPAPELGADRSGLDWILSVVADASKADGGKSANREAPTRPLAERWDGSKWRTVDAPNTGPSSEWFAISRIPGTGLMAIGSTSPSTTTRPLVERRHADGSWSRGSVPAPDVRMAYLSAAAAISRSNIWAVGPTNATPLALHWNGSDWRPSPLS